MTDLGLLWPATHEETRTHRLALADDDLHVWSVSLAAPADRVAAYEATLSVDERARAARFRFAVHRDRYIVGRGVLRALLARYVGAPPAALRFESTANGKPVLGGEWKGALHFNVSHADDLALYGMTTRYELGVDVERVKELDDLEEVASGYFSPAERRVLASLPPADRPQAFYNCWTRKEAYIKATGEGLACPLQSFDVSLAPGAPPRMLAIGGSREEGAAWSLLHLVPAQGYVGAVALRAAPPRPLCRRWAGEP